MEQETLNHLGRVSSLPTEPNIAILESVPNPHEGSNYTVRFTCLNLPHCAQLQASLILPPCNRLSAAKQAC